MSVLVKHRDINNSIIPKLDIPDTVHLKEAGLLYWDNRKIADESNIKISNLRLKFRIDNEITINKIAESNLDKKSYSAYLRLVQDLKDGYIYTDSPGHSEDYTNFLAKVNQATNDKYGLTYYKRINPNEDRLVYRIVKPSINKNTNKLETIIQLKSCIGHEYRLNPNGPVIVRFSELEVEDYFDEVNADDIYNPSLTELDW